MNSGKIIWGTGAALFLTAVLVVCFHLARQRAAHTSGGPGGPGGGPRAAETDQAAGERHSGRRISKGVAAGPHGGRAAVTSVGLRGVLPSGLKDRHGLSEERFRNCQMIVSAFWKDGLERMRRNFHFDEDASTENMDVYRIPAMPGEDRKMLFDNLRNELESAGNGRLAEEVVEGVSQSEAFAGFGKFDAELRFARRLVTVSDPIADTSGEVVDVGNAAVSYSFHDPITGEVVREVTGGDLLSIEPVFGVFRMSGFGGWESLLQEQ